MGKKKVLIVSCTPFYGGAEIFVKQIFPILEDQFDIYYQLRSYDLYNELSSKNKYFLIVNVFLGEFFSQKYCLY